jgi:hypothetical protein
MTSKSPLHVPFAQLPSEARVLFFIYASAALVGYVSQPPTLADLTTELEVAWNENRLSQHDLSETSHMTSLLEHHFLASGTAQAKCRVKASSGMEDTK